MSISYNDDYITCKPENYLSILNNILYLSRQHIGVWETEFLNTQEIDEPKPTIRYLDELVKYQKADTEKLVMIYYNKDNIGIRFPYDAELVETIRGIPGRKYDTQYKTWYIPNDQKVNLISHLKTNNYRFYEN